MTRVIHVILPVGYILLFSLFAELGFSVFGYISLEEGFSFSLNGFSVLFFAGIFSGMILLSLLKLLAAQPRMVVLVFHSAAAVLVSIVLQSLFGPSPWRLMRDEPYYVGLLYLCIVIGLPLASLMNRTANTTLNWTRKKLRAS